MKYQYCTIEVGPGYSLPVETMWEPCAVLPVPRPGLPDRLFLVLRREYTEGQS